MVYSQPAGLTGTPSAGQRSTARAMASLRASSPAPLDHRVEVGSIENVVSADLFGRFGERAVGDGHLTTPCPQGGGHRAVPQRLPAQYLHPGPGRAGLIEGDVLGHPGLLLLRSQLVPRCHLTYSGKKNKVLHSRLLLRYGRRPPPTPTMTRRSTANRQCRRTMSYPIIQTHEKDVLVQSLGRSGGRQMMTNFAMIRYRLRHVDDERVTTR